MISMNISKLNVTANEAMTTCGEWCKVQHHDFFVTQLMIIPIIVVVILSFGYIIERVKDLGQLEIYRGKILDAVNTSTRVLMVGFLIQLLMIS